MKSIYEFLLKSKTAVSTQDTDYVDLGLPSGLLWAKCNIGADKPYEYGDYFMWGSTKPNTHDNCNWETAPFNNGKLVFDKEYMKSVKNKICTKDNNLIQKYDVTTLNSCRMPTKNDYIELIDGDNTKHEWVKNYEGKNIDGLIFTSIHNDNTLFIPAAGFISGTTPYNKNGYICLWSSSLFSYNISKAYCLFADKFDCLLDNDIRFRGYNIRAVK